MSMPRRPTYTTVQMLRGFAASAVVLFHLLPFEQKYLTGPTIMPDTLVVGQAGVDVFFVISGFIVTTVSINHAGRPRDSLDFLIRRFWRIYPAYWVYYAVLVAVYFSAPGLINHSAHRGPSLLDSFTLWPSDAPPLLLVAWTLSFELYFYLVFSVLLCVVPRSRLGVVLPLWATLVIGGRLAMPLHHTALMDVVCNPLNLEFMTGCAIALWAPLVRHQIGLLLIVAGIAWGVMLTQFVGPAAPFQNVWLRVAVFGGSAALIVAGCAVWERPGITRVPGVLRQLGDASYSLYLSHLLTIGLVGLMWRHVIQLTTQPAFTSLPVHVTALISAFAASVGVGMLSYRLIETPLIGMMKRVRPIAPRPAIAANTEATRLKAGLFWGR
jgi:peptidoglycan/LPS O-acetylase OafA/YrhL